MRSFLRSAGCEEGSAKLTPAERARCQERFGAVRGSEPPPPKGWAARRRADEAQRDQSLLAKEFGIPPCTGVCVRFGEPPKPSPNIPAHTLRGDDDALKPRKPEPKPTNPPGS